VSKKKARFRVEEDEDPEFQVAPMVDVLLVLLIFFMSITSTEVLKNNKEVDLPDANKGKKADAKANMLVINVEWHLKAGLMTVEDKSYNDPYNLKPVLLSRFQANPLLRILIRADRSTEFDFVSQIMKVCSECQIANVTFAVSQGGDGAAAAAPAEGGK
jgi:biopolymer transport protein ExbD